MPAHPMQTPPHFFPQALNIARILPKNQGDDFSVQKNFRGLTPSADRIREAEALCSSIGMDGGSYDLQALDLLSSIHDASVWRKTIVGCVNTINPDNCSSPVQQKRE